MHRRLLETQLSMPPSNENNKFIGDGSFDANMVIILGVLLCALICALAINSMARCFMRCRQRFSQGTPARLAGRGLKKSDLSQIPVTVYGSGENIPATECPICLGEYERGDRVRILPECNHGFHVRCIDTWLVSHSSCPICRHSVLEKQETTVSEVAGDELPETEAGRRGDVVVVVEQAS